jgi:hypothetical protein
VNSTTLCLGSVPYTVIVHTDCDGNPTGTVSYININTGVVTNTSPGALQPCDVSVEGGGVLLCENVQDCISGMFLNVGFQYNDSSNSFDSTGVNGYVLTADGTGHAVWSDFVPGSIDLTSPNATITVGGTSSAPTVDVNWNDSDNRNGVRAAMATSLVGFNIEWNGTLGKFVNTAASGLVLVSDGVGGAYWTTPINYSTYSISGLDCSGTVSSAFKLPGDSLRFVVADGGGKFVVSKVGAELTVTLTNTRSKLRVASGAAGAVSTANVDVFIVTSGTDVVVSAPSSCDPTDIWIKNNTNSVIYVSPSSGTIDGNSYIYLNPVSENNGIVHKPSVHLVWDGAGFIILEQV